MKKIKFLLIIITLISFNISAQKIVKGKSNRLTNVKIIGGNQANAVVGKSNRLKNVYISSDLADLIPPKIAVIEPAVKRGFKLVVSGESVNVLAEVTDHSGVKSVFINNIQANLTKDNIYQSTINLNDGENTITVTATDFKGNAVTEQFQIVKKEAVAVIDVPANNTEDVISDIGKFYAIIIGNSEYADQAIASLDEPVKDATKLYDVLTNQYVFEPENVTFLKNATYVQMIETLDNMSKKITDKDNLLFFYAGHGWWDETKNLGYWLPCDAKKQNTAFWIRNSTISDYMASIKTKHTLLIADACFSGSIFKTRSAFTDAPISIVKLYDIASRKAMTSGNMKEVPDKSVFLQYLVKRLADNTEKYLSSDVLFASFRQAVLNNSPTEPQYGTIQNAGDEGGEFIFIRR